jgi:hypothetical protein
MHEVQVSYEDAFCNIPEFYERLAKKVADKTGDRSYLNKHYDCCKIDVPRFVKDAFFDWAEAEFGKESLKEASMLWVCSGPKAYVGGVVILHDGFFIEPVEEVLYDHN